MHVTGGQDFDNILASLRMLHFSASTRPRRATGGVEYEQCFNISTLPDMLVEQNETFNLLLSTADLSVQFQPQSASVVIIDNDGKIYNLNWYRYHSLQSCTYLTLLCTATKNAHISIKQAQRDFKQVANA